jgi:hypothetical protein
MYYEDKQKGCLDSNLKYADYCSAYWLHLKTVKCYIFLGNEKFFQVNNLLLFPLDRMSHQYFLSISFLRNGTVFRVFIISKLVLADFRHNNCKVDGEDEEYMTFITDFAAVADNIGYRVRP